MENIVAALFVRTHGCYYGMSDIDPWDKERDACKYTGPYPVIAHPPCQRWGKFWAGSPSYIAKTGIRKVKGDDGGCFRAALKSVREYGGVLEHPYLSYAWQFFDIPKPSRQGGWIETPCGGFTCCVEQGRYGHYARKPTYLLTYKTKLPELDWGISEPKYPDWAIKKYGLKRVKRMGELAFKGGGIDSAYRTDTPVEFRDLLISLAQSVYENR